MAKKYSADDIADMLLQSYKRARGYATGNDKRCMEMMIEYVMMAVTDKMEEKDAIACWSKLEERIKAYEHYLFHKA